MRIALVEDDQKAARLLPREGLRRGCPAADCLSVVICAATLATVASSINVNAIGAIVLPNAPG